MKKRARMCIYIFIACAVFALGILGYFVFNDSADNVMIGSRKFVTFNEVPGAASYSVSVNNSQDYIANYTVEKQETDKEDQYSFKIEVSLPGGLKLATENYIQEITEKNIKDKTIDCIIKDYTVDFFNSFGEKTETINLEDQTLKNIDENIFCCVVSEYFGSLFNKDGKYNISFVAYDSLGNKIENSEKNFDYSYFAYYEREFARRESFFINGKEYDYIITSQEELEKLVWHTILYRKDDVSFYIKTNTVNSRNIDNLVYNAIVDYPEYDALEDSNNYVDIEGNVGTLVNFDYYLAENFTKTYKDLEEKDPEVYDEVKENVYKKDTNYSADFIRKTPTERTFAIDEAVQEVEVYNTEQLFNVVQYGLKPVFTAESEIAQTVYNNAKDELKKINNSNYLTDYEKALNIYRYICTEVIYDWVTYEFMMETNDQTIKSFGDYSCFYLEGVFLDLENQFAVCDGLSKAYVLLCSIEGIDCVKVNGKADGAGHAWNKVHLVDNEYNVNGWYNVDTTWGVANYVAYNSDSEPEFYEILTHTYFLDGDFSDREILFEGEVEEQALEFNYYKNTNFTFEQTSGDLYIESEQELKDVFEYAEYCLNNGKNSFVVEIEIDVDFYESGSLIESNTNVSLKYLLEDLTADKKHLTKLIEFETENGNFIKAMQYKNELAAVENKISNWFVLNGVADNINYEWIICDEVFMFRFFK